MMKGGMAGLMKQAQQMQEKMQKMQEELANAEVTGQSGAGLVSVVMTGRHDVKRVSLDDSLMQEDKEILEDLIAAAVNDAVRKVEQNSQDKMSGMTAGMQLPPGKKCPSDWLRAVQSMHMAALPAGSGSSFAPTHRGSSPPAPLPRPPPCPP